MSSALSNWLIYFKPSTNKLEIQFLLLLRLTIARLGYLLATVACRASFIGMVKWAIALAPPPACFFQPFSDIPSSNMANARGADGQKGQFGCQLACLAIIKLPYIVPGTLCAHYTPRLKPHLKCGALKTLSYWPALDFYHCPYPLFWSH